METLRASLSCLKGPRTPLECLFYSLSAGFLLSLCGSPKHNLPSMATAQPALASVGSSLVLRHLVYTEVCTSLCNLPSTGVSLLNEDLKIHTDVKKDRLKKIPISTLGMLSWMLNVWSAYF